MEEKFKPREVVSTQNVNLFTASQSLSLEEEREVIASLSPSEWGKLNFLSTDGGRTDILKGWREK